MKTLALLIVFAASVALADEFKTINGKEYKNAKVSRAIGETPPQLPVLHAHFWLFHFFVRQTLPPPPKE
jgi:hypothetical protein